MSRTSDPYIRFDFVLDDEEKESVRNALREWSELLDVPAAAELSVSYHVRFNRPTQSEDRFFSIGGVPLPKKTLVLRPDALTDGYLIKVGDTFFALAEMCFISESILADNAKHAALSDDLTTLTDRLSAAQAALDSSLNEATADASASESAESATTSSAAANTDVGSAHNDAPRMSPRIERQRAEIKRLKLQQTQLASQLGPFDIDQLLGELRVKLDLLEQTITDLDDKLIAAEKAISEPPDATLTAQDQATKTATAKNHLGALEDRLIKAEREKKSAERLIASLSEPLLDKYSDNPSDLPCRLGDAVADLLASFLPRAVFWKYSDDYILQSETTFEEMKSASTLNDISRPLVNIFRIGLDINTLDDLHAVIQEIQGDSSERSRYQKRLNRRIDTYLKSVWADYDQQISIALEQERIRVQFFDPSCVDASYYNMQERSQGCQTFISFLLTIGAEAKHGVISNTVLLLDEPETHLHPSGVRFMLRELIKAANNGNTVVFATHSVFMIDKDTYDCHVIIKKEKEETIIQPSTKDRIGFFMQEEVLYSALDVDVAGEFAVRNEYNVVLEGEGDAILFERFYNRALRKDKDRPFPATKTSFYHGGKCSAMLKYFSQKPIQLGTTWVFVLDNDTAANKLRAFIEARYRHYLDKHIYIFQYGRTDLDGGPVELEDLLPFEDIKTVALKAAEKLSCRMDWAKIDGSRRFSDYFGDVTAACIDREGFKAAFKDELNRHIESATEGVKKIEDMAAFAPAYASWAGDIVTQIIKSRHETGISGAKK